MNIPQLGRGPGFACYTAWGTETDGILSVCYGTVLPIILQLHKPPCVPLARIGAKDWEEAVRYANDWQNHARCLWCGKELFGQAYCPNCGREVNRVAVTQTERAS